MKTIAKITPVSLACMSLTACDFITFGDPDLGVTRLHSLETKPTMVSLARKDGSFSMDAASQSATLTYIGKTYSGLVSSTNNPDIYTKAFGDATAYAKPVKSGKDASLWVVSLIDYEGEYTGALAYVVDGTPTADLPSGKGQYIGSLDATFISKEIATLKANETNSSLKLDVDFGAGTFGGKTSSHSDQNQNAVAGYIEITNGKINDGKATFDIATKDNLINNLGLDGGAMSGTGDARFYKDSNTNFDKAHDLIGTGSLENSSTVGVFGISGGYHPPSAF